MARKQFEMTERSGQQMVRNWSTNGELYVLCDEFGKPIGNIWEMPRKRSEMVEMAMIWQKIWPRDRLEWSEDGKKILEIVSEWSQVGQLNGQELGEDCEDKR